MSYIQTLSGKHFNYLDIQQDDIVIEDIRGSDVMDAIADMEDEE